MSASLSVSIPLLWGQAFLPGVEGWLRPIMPWLFVFGEPTYTLPGLLGGLITWLKAVSLFCLFGWAASWLVAAMKERTVARGSWLDIAALVAVVGGVGTMLLRVLESTGRMPVYVIPSLGGIYFVSVLTLVFGGVVFLWVETALWGSIRRLGRGGDVLVLLGMHLALALGLFVGFVSMRAANRLGAGNAQIPVVSLTDGLVYGVRMSATYMGYVVLLKVLGQVAVEVLAVRWRRIYAIARNSVVESNRRMWAPWVVLTVFLVVLAFTHWFLQPPRPAEMGRLFVGTLILLCSLLLTVMVTLLTPLSLPQDIQYQTIYTVVSKPVRRLELVWGRVLGFMAIVSVLVLVFGAIDLMYLKRTVGGTILATEELAKDKLKKGNTMEAAQLREQADQIRTRMAARVPVYGSLTFLDSRGTPHLKGIDVGQEQSTREPRSHIEGATPATAIWKYGIVRDPYQPANQRPVYLDRRIPVDSLLTADSVEGMQNRMLLLKQQVAQADAAPAGGEANANANGNPNPKAKDAAAAARLKEELRQATAAYEQQKTLADKLQAEAAAAEKAGQASKAQSDREQAAKLHSPLIPIEMTFNVYRTTKGRVGEPVYAEIEITNPNAPSIPNVNPWRNIFPIREYYTNKLYVPPAVLAGSNGALQVEVRCISRTQYLGMAERDLFILVQTENFGTNFMKGLFGVWLQAMVLTAIGVFAGTFLSWPVALLTTIAFFVAGQVAFSFLLEFTRQSLIGGGPFESLLRLLTHDNQMSELAATPPVVVAKTLDALVMPVLSRLVYIVPNFSALDVSNTVADGFAVSWGLMLSNLFLAVAYALPFSIAGYFILKNREVAA
jgi:hypothetical protein